MAELCVSSQSSFLLHRPQTGILHRLNPQTSISLSQTGAGAPLLRFVPSSLGVVSDPTAPSLFTVDSGTKGIVIEPEIGGGDGGEFGGRGGGGGGGGGDNSNDRGEEGGEDSSEKQGMSMSQKLTLAYAVLVGVGGVMGFLKSGSNKSLLAGGISASLLYLVYTELPKRTVFASSLGLDRASLLYLVYTELPKRTVFASSLGLGLSTALLVVMGSRFKRSGKIFPAGVVSLVSLIMTGGYFHGILRGMH